MPTEFPIADTIAVNISRETLFPSTAGFGTIMIAGTGSVISHGERVRYYTSLTGVVSDFAITDEEYLAAKAAFSQNPKPARVAIGSVLSASAAGYMNGGAVGTPATLAAITTGSFSITIDGVSNDIGSVNFAGDTTVSQIAGTVQVAIQAVGTGGFTAATVVEEPTGRLKISSGTTGAVSSVSALGSTGAGVDVSGAGLLNARSAVSTVIGGHLFVNLAGELAAIEARDDDWYGLALTRDLSGIANYEAAAAFVEGRKKILAAFDDSLIALDPLSVGDLPYLLKASGYARTFCHWSSDSTKYPEVSALARLATVDYEIPGSAITLKFQQLPGITPVSITTSQRNSLITKNAQIYASRGGVSMLEEGKQCNGEFTDVIHGADWIEQTMAIRVFGELYVESNKIAMTDTGVARLESKVKEVLDTAVSADLIANDFDDAGKLQPAFTITTTSVLDHPQASRAARIGPPIIFEGRLSGAIHSQTITGVVTV